jgi:hypothetical protein
MPNSWLAKADPPKKFLGAARHGVRNVKADLLRLWSYS